MESAALSESVSVAKLSAGACRIGTRRGFKASACGEPENRTGGVFGVRRGDDGTLIGTMEAGSCLLGKWEMRGVPGGAGMRENSGAREVNGVCVVDRAKMMLTFLESRETRDCGVMSGAYASDRK